jgi:hypothetical protein
MRPDALAGGAGRGQTGLRLGLAPPDVRHGRGGCGGPQKPRRVVLSVKPCDNPCDATALW